ncbi:MAG TPA: hypothetical protein VLA09_04765 [Longimicrobiales bacterium]|nr:hypothetical protein [Longimicrobiales bacterium]
MADNASRRGAVEMGTILMILAFVIIGGFLYWLNVQAAVERELAIVEDTVPDDTGLTAQTVAGEDIQMDATPFEGQEIRLASFEVQSTLGTQGFWLGMPNGNPFLVSMSPEVMAAGVAVATGSRATVIGTVHAMNDSTLTAWTEAGTIGEGDRIVAEFATHFLEATDVQVSGGGASDGGS